MFEISFGSYVQLQKYEVSLFNGGRMLIKGVTDEKNALEVYREILKKLESQLLSSAQRIIEATQLRQLRRQRQLLDILLG